VITFAIESSTARCSTVIFRDDAVLAEAAWEASPTDHQRLFREIPGLFRQAGVGPADVGLYAVGIGPGRFSGLRVALATANAMAQPGRCPVIGVSAGEAMAYDLPQQTGSASFSAVGDARRGRLWFVRMDIPTAFAGTPAYESVDAAQLSAYLRPGDRVLTSEWPALAALIEDACRRSGAEPICARTSPSAVNVARVALLKAAQVPAGRSLPPSIVYVHPAVATTHD
jgi:tRNA threonylcarbamoyladenosine biosynthesis protein TsaB